jgi:ABC-type antimicrobial peptide transport system permease subunit
MNQFKFIIRSLIFFKKQHFWVFLAALVSTAVLTGALVIGDSVKYSLINLVDQRLGKVEYTLMAGDRFVRSNLADEIGAEIGAQAASILMMQGIVVNTESQSRISSAQILGVDEAFWKLADGIPPEWTSFGIVISQNVADQLLAKPGDELLIRVRKAEIIPLNAPFSEEETSTVAMRLPISAIAGSHQLGRFSIRNNQLAPYNIFVPKKLLAEKMGLVGLANLVVVGGVDNLSQSKLNASLQSNWKLEDAALSLSYLADSSVIQLLSERVFIDQSISDRLEEWSLFHQNILTYFVNSFRFKGNETPYSFVTAASHNFLGKTLNDKQIIVNSWLANDLQISVGDSLQVDYFSMGPMRKLVEKSDWFVVADIVGVELKSLNRSLMPAFPGLTEAGNCRDWEAGIPIDLEKIRDKDEQYWSDYRGTPKAYISLKKGLQLWENPFGNYTAIRFPSDAISLVDLESQLLQILSPSDINLSFVPVREQGKQAASNGVDFGQLFLSLSFFVIAAAILLLVLIYSLNLESRRRETGVVHALGFNRKQLIRLRVLESIPNLLLSAVLGGLLGIIYNKLMLYGLNSVWNDAVHADMIKMEIRLQTIITGMLAGVFIALVSIYVVTVRSFKSSIVSVIRQQSSSVTFRKSWFNGLLVALGWGGALALVIYSLSTNLVQNASLVLVAGFLFLMGSAALVSMLLNPSLVKGLNKGKFHNFRQLVWKNTGRNKNRSMAVVWLLALGTFTIIVTGANRKTFVNTENQRTSGTGGFPFWVETSVPILHDLNTREGRSVLGLDGDDMPEKVSFVQFYSLPGDDASCLNLNQVQLPHILGVDPSVFDGLGAFSFSNLLDESPSPWLQLTENRGSGVIPAIADQTVIQWGLMKSIGDTLNYLNERGDTIRLLLVGGLNPSVFQGNILISDSCFLANFPSSGGSQLMLVEVPSSQEKQMEQLLKSRWVDYGVEIMSAPKRLAAFYSVTNTYLSIFMILGGLGVILGTVGMGIVLMRNMLDRKHEMAVLKALGFTQKQLFQLIVMENMWLLLIGMVIGIMSALIGILPSLLSPAFQIPGYFLIVLVVGVFFSGTLWIVLASHWAIKRNLGNELRNE